MKKSNTTDHSAQRTFRRYFPLIFMLPLFIIWSCDRQGSSPLAVDQLEDGFPPSLTVLDGPAITAPAPSPCLPKLGPEHSDQQHEAVSLDSDGLPLQSSCLSAFDGPAPSPKAGALMEQELLLEKFMVEIPGFQRELEQESVGHQQNAIRQFDLEQPLLSTSPPGAATLSSPSGSINSAAPQFTWQAVSGATWYYVWVRDSGTMDYSGSPRIAHWITASDAGCGSGSGTCSWYADKNLESGDAKWWIRTWNSAGYGPWSSAMDFSVSGSVSLPATVTLVSPDSDVSTTTPELTWNSASGATWYYVWVRDSETMNFSGEP